MKMQLALDVNTWDDAMKLLEVAGDVTDIIEVGSPLIESMGYTNTVQRVREMYPDKVIFADMKVMDASAWMIPGAFHAGADIASVLAVAHDFTLTEHVRVAHEMGKKAAVDLIGIPTRELEAKMEELVSFGFDYYYMHAPSEALRPTEPLQHVRIRKMLKYIDSSQLGIAHSLDFAKLEEVLQYQPEYTVVSLPMMLPILMNHDMETARANALKCRKIFDEANKKYGA